MLRYFILLFSFPLFAQAQVPTLQDLNGQPCAIDKSASAKTNEARTEVELAMFKLIDENHNFQSEPPRCLSVVECNKLIKAVQVDLAANQEMIYKYEGPVLAQALHEIQSGSPLATTTLEFIKRSSHYFQDSSLDGWLASGAPEPAAHTSERQTAYANLSRYAAHKWDMSTYKNEAAQEQADIQTMQSQLQDLQTKIYPNAAAALQAEEAKWGAYLDAQPAQAHLPQCGLSVAERASLWWYTSMGYRVINTLLRKGQAAAWQPLTDVMEHGMKKLRRFEGPVYRGTTLPPEILKQYFAGAQIDSPAYTSTSASAQDHFSGDQQFTIQSQSGRWIAPFSANPKELEVLIPNGVKFKVQENSGSKIRMEEIPN